MRVILILGLLLFLIQVTFAAESQAANEETFASGVRSDRIIEETRGGTLTLPADPVSLLAKRALHHIIQTERNG